MTVCTDAVKDDKCFFEEKKIISIITIFFFTELYTCCQFLDPFSSVTSIGVAHTLYKRGRYLVAFSSNRQ